MIDVAFITQRVGRDIRASSWLFTREAVDEISEACFSGDPRASCVGPQHDRGRSYTVMISMNFDSYANLAIFCIIPGPVLFLNSNFIYYTSVSCVSVLSDRYNLADGVAALTQLYALFSHRARSFNQFYNKVRI